MMNGGTWDGYVESRFQYFFIRLEILWLPGTVLCDGWSILLLPNIMVGPMLFNKNYFILFYLLQTVIIINLQIHKSHEIYL